MLSTTLVRIRCPQCERKLTLAGDDAPQGAAPTEIRMGELRCAPCGMKYPILAGVAILVEDVGGYLAAHVKGISKLVPDDQIPRAFAREYREARRELTAMQAEHIEEDLEAERVNALYLLNHYLYAGSAKQKWWRPLAGEEGSPLMDSLIRENWDRGPLSQIASWIGKLENPGNVLELGCGVGGLYTRIRNGIEAYLGVDNSFTSIALARHLALGMPYPGTLEIPADLLDGGVSRQVEFPPAPPCDGRADFVVGDLAGSPLASGEWDVSVALNAIDMLEDPGLLPKLQHESLKAGGIAIQSCPYIWHSEVAKHLRARLPRGVRGSAQAVEWLYAQAGFTVTEKTEHLPWLFFKHLRQLEVYSVHAFMARKGVAK